MKKCGLKIQTIGENAHPLWRYLAKESGVEPLWNFYKYLIDHTGKFVKVWDVERSVDEAYDTIAKYVKKAKKAGKKHKNIK